MEPNWLHIKAHEKAVCVLVRLLRKRNKGRSKETFTNLCQAYQRLPTRAGLFCVGLVFLYQIIFKFYSYLGQVQGWKSNTTACSPAPTTFPQANCRRSDGSTTPRWNQKRQLLCTTLPKLRKEKGPRTYPGNSFFYFVIQQGKSSQGAAVLLVAAEPKVCRERWQRAPAAANRLHCYCCIQLAARCICLPALGLLQTKTDE